MASHPSWYRKQRGFQRDRNYPSQNPVIPDIVSSFRPETLLQPYPTALPNSQATSVQQKLDSVAGTNVQQIYMMSMLKHRLT
jgi:hypothetical protein